VQEIINLRNIMKSVEAEIERLGWSRELKTQTPESRASISVAKKLPLSLRNFKMTKKRSHSIA